MLTIIVPAVDLFDENSMTFMTSDELVLKLEHSLDSLSKWESNFKKPFLSKTPKTLEETLFYIDCMVVSPELNESIAERLSSESHELIREYMESKQTATTINEEPSKGVSEVITAEIIEQWMVALTIPFECRHWHLDRLLTLIKICNIKSQPPKKQSKMAMSTRRSQLNAARKARLGTTG